VQCVFHTLLLRPYITNAPVSYILPACWHPPRPFPSSPCGHGHGPNPSSSQLNFDRKPRSSPGTHDLPRIFARVYRHPPGVHPSRFAASRARISTAMGVIFDERKYPVVDSAPTVRSTGTNPPEAPWTRNGSARKPSSCTARSLNRRTNACHGVADDSRCTSKTAC